LIKLLLLHSPQGPEAVGPAVPSLSPSKPRSRGASKSCRNAIGTDMTNLLGSPR
jgi:hypothetical protein